MFDFTNIERKLRRIHTLCKLNKYYDSIFYESIMLSMPDVCKLDRLFRRNYEIHSEIYIHQKDKYINLF